MDDAMLRAYDQWMEDGGLSAKTRECRGSVLGLLARHAGRPLAELAAADLDGWQHSLRMSTSARHTYVKYVIGFYGWAHARGLLDADPSGLLVLPVLPRRLPRPIADDDLDLALQAAPHGSQLAAWLYLMCLAGLRCAEVAAVERPDVHDQLARPMLLVHGKGAHERVVPVPPPLLWALRPFLPRAGRLFTRLDGTGVAHPKIVSENVNRHLHGLGIPATAHQLRHWYGTALYQGTQDLRLTQECMGHMSPVTTAGYAAFDQRHAATVSAALAGRLTANHQHRQEITA